MLKTIDRFSKNSIFSLSLLTALVGCTPQQGTVAPTDSTAPPQATEQTTEQTDATTSREDTRIPSEEEAPTAQPPKQDTPKPIFPALEAGEYCYFVETETDTLHARLAIDTADRVTGNLQGAVHNAASSYYTSYSQAVDGTIDGNNLNLDVTTWIEYDKQNQQETWKVSDSTLTVNNNTLPQESCDTVSKAFQNENGLEAKDLTSGANQVHTQQVSFTAGSSGTVVSNAVVRGDRDVYQLIAQGGQSMKLSISSLEDNAVFDVVSPSDMILGTELTQDDIFLPHTGEYEIIVGGTRGNASYELDIEIE